MNSRWTTGTIRSLALIGVAITTAVLVLLFLNRPESSVPKTKLDKEQIKKVAGEPLTYIALGDSLSRGVQPEIPVGSNRVTNQGYPRVLYKLLKTSYPRTELVEAGCGGATTTSMIRGGTPCAPDAEIPYGNNDRENSQLNWAIRTLKARGDRPTLLTLDIGGNDIIQCRNADPKRATACLKRLLPSISKRWRKIARTLSSAAGEQTVLAVSTNYNPFVAVLADGGPFENLRPAARVFHEQIVKSYNPAMARIFERFDWRVADLARAMEQQRPISGKSPLPASRVCQLTWMCTRLDVHLNAEGYGLAGRTFWRQVRQPLSQLDAN